MDLSKAFDGKPDDLLIANLNLKEKPLEKGCNTKSSYEKGFCKQWGQQTCHQFEESKSVHAPPLF